MVFPWIQFLKSGGKRLSDIEFLAIKEFGSKIRHAEGVLSATGDLATLTATAGKDMYLAKAKINAYLTALDGTTQTCIVELKVNAVVKETAHITFVSLGAGSAHRTVPYEFVIQGLKVAATQIIKLEVTSIGASVDVEGTLLCFEEATGDTPQV